MVSNDLIFILEEPSFYEVPSIISQNDLYNFQFLVLQIAPLCFSITTGQTYFPGME